MESQTKLSVSATHSFFFFNSQEMFKDRISDNHVIYFYCVSILHHMFLKALYSVCMKLKKYTLM